MNRWLQVGEILCPDHFRALRDARKPIETRDDWTQSKHRHPADLDVPTFGEDGHTIYVGKQAIKPSQRENSTYPDLVWEAILPFVAGKIEGSGKVRIVLCSDLSRYCNDADHFQGFMSHEMQTEHVQSWADRMGLGERVTIERICDRHSRLFSALEAAQMEQVSLTDRFLNFPLGESCDDSFELALRLIHAAQESKDFLGRARRCIPSDIRPTQDSLTPADLYPLLELAIRLDDARKGIVVQMGVSRQAGYNAILVDLVRGPKDQNAHLRQVHASVANSQFYELNFDLEKSEAAQMQRVEKARRKVRRDYAGIASVCFAGLALAGTAYEAGRYHEIERFDATAEKVRDLKLGIATKIHACHGPDSWLHDRDPSTIVQRIDASLGAARDSLELRFDVHFNEYDWNMTWVPALLGTMNQEGAPVDSMCNGRYYDRENSNWLDFALLKEWGLFSGQYPLSDRPFGHTLANYETLLRSSATSTAERTWPMRATPARKIGEIMLSSTPTPIYLIQVDRVDVVVSPDYAGTTFFESYGRNAARAYFEQMKAWNLHQMDGLKTVIPANAWAPVILETDEDRAAWNLDIQACKPQETAHYTNPWTLQHYELGSCPSTAVPYTDRVVVGRYASGESWSHAVVRRFEAEEMSGSIDFLK